VEELVFYYEQDCPICTKVRVDVCDALEAELSTREHAEIRFTRIEINANRGGAHRGWFTGYTRRIGREIAPSIKYGLDILFVPHLPNLPYEEREKVARSEKLMREVEVVRKRILDIAKQNLIPRTPLPLNMTHRMYRTGYMVPRRI
jgi:hypothetical protein